MLKKLLLFLCLNSVLFASTPSFKYTYKFTLKKDERASVEIKELGFEDKVQNFDFYWTLFDTNKIIVHTKYRKFPRQFVLSLRRNLNWATQTLIPDYTKPNVDRARLIFEFSEFNKKSEAVFTIYIEDAESRLEVKFIDPRKQNLNANTN